MKTFKEWCNEERVGRVEEGTSQDMFRTKGEGLFANLYVIFMILFLIFMASLSQ